MVYLEFARRTEVSPTRGKYIGQASCCHGSLLLKVLGYTALIIALRTELSYTVGKQLTLDSAPCFSVKDSCPVQLVRDFSLCLSVTSLIAQLKKQCIFNSRQGQSLAGYFCDFRLHGS